MTTNLPCEDLRRLYVEQGLGVAAVAALMGRSPSTISNRLRACGIPTRSGRFQARLIPRDLLEQLYSVEALPLPAIAARLGISVGTVHNRRRAYGIPTRPRRRVASGLQKALVPPPTQG